MEESDLKRLVNLLLLEVNHFWDFEGIMGSEELIDLIDIYLDKGIKSSPKPNNTPY